VSSVRPQSGCVGLVRSSSRLGARRATAGEVTPDRAPSHAGNRVIVQSLRRAGPRAVTGGLPPLAEVPPSHRSTKFGSNARHAARVVLMVTNRH
jgi:hypothetical protein